MGHTPGRELREQSSERKTVVWGRVSRDWKVARNQKIKSGRTGSLDSKDTAVQGPWRKKAESEAGGNPRIQWVRRQDQTQSRPEDALPWG